MNNEKQTSEIQWGGWLNEFLWVCAGVNRKVLRQCPTDYAKYAGIGGTILFTALMAMLSGGYAFFFVFNSTTLAIAFGIFWGLLIFNLDRFIVNTMYSDGKVTISKREFISGLPRIIMAVFLGIVISTPLEMKIFEDRINSQLINDNLRRTEESRGLASTDYQNLTSLKTERQNLLNQRKALSDTLLHAQEDLRREGEGSALSGKIGHGPIYRDKELYATHCQAALDDWNEINTPRLEELNRNITDAQENIKRIESDIDKGQEENGFCVRYEAFSNVRASSTSLEIVSTIIMLLFIIIETAPTFFKMMIASGPYDDLLRARMHKVKILADKEISDINDEVNTSVEISTLQNQNRLEAEIAANKELLEKIALAQSEILSEAIELWRKEELEKVRKDPSAYIKSSMEDPIDPQ